MIVLKYFSLITTITIFVGLFSIILQGYIAARNLQRITTILLNLLRLENSNDSVILYKPKIAIGYGSCSDLYVHAPTFLNYTDELLNNSDHFDEDINSLNELLQSFAYYFKHGAAAERHTTNAELFQFLIKAAKAKKNNIKWMIGGNAPLMAIRFLKEGGEVLMASQMSEKLRKLLPKEISLLAEPIENDDIHLIMEYKAKDKWGPFTAPRANRYILHNDQHNPVLTSLEQFDTILDDYKPRLLVVSGMQIMDNFPFPLGLRENRIQKVRAQMASLPKTTLIHFEMASFVGLDLLKSISNNIIPYSDSLGMNEQELENLERVVEKGKVSMMADSNPRVSVVLKQMRSLYKLFNEDYFSNFNLDGNRRLISRIHVHTLAYQAFLVVKDKKYNENGWKNTKNAAAKASLTAYRHVCGTDEINPESAYLILDDSFSTASNDTKVPRRISIDKNDPVSCWNEEIYLDKNNVALDIEMCLSPVLVCRVAKQTAGAGDNISAAGLILQL